MRAAHGSTALFGRGARKAKASDTELVSWIRPSETKRFIEWAQEAYCNARTDAAVHEETFGMRPPAFRRRGLTCEAAVALSIPDGAPRNKMFAQLAFRPIRTSQAAF